MQDGQLGEEKGGVDRSADGYCTCPDEDLFTFNDGRNCKLALMYRPDTCGHSTGFTKVPLDELCGATTMRSNQCGKVKGSTSGRRMDVLLCMSFFMTDILSNSCCAQHQVRLVES